ncbi:hypothetical protein ACS0TY_003519 [Phlomoides rotata]
MILVLVSRLMPLLPLAFLPTITPYKHLQLSRSATSATNSPDAKVFEDFENSGHKSNPTLPAAATANSTASANDKSDGGKRWLGMVSFLLVTMVVVVVLNLKVKLVV